jgi:hypothetical protein
MKSMTALAAALGLAFAVAATSSAFAADPRGATPSRPNRVTAVPPPPPPPGGFDRFVTQGPPSAPGSLTGAPAPLEEARRHQCNPYVTNCGIFRSWCTAVGGVLTNDGTHLICTTD